MTRVLIAPDKFKGSLTAEQVAAALARGMLGVRSDLDVVRMPVADGGDGTVAAAVAAGFDEFGVSATGPTGAPVLTSYARRGDTAVVEMADACGLSRLPRAQQAPLTASSRGLGDVIGAAISAGCTRIVVGIGGSASTDGGAGLLCALGALALDQQGGPLGEGGAALADIGSADFARLKERVAGVEFVVACDVDNPLTGCDGAAAIYGPQKGASPAEVRVLDGALERWADVVSAITGNDVRDHAGAGAAGGVGFGLLAVLGAQLRSGADLVFDLIGLPQQLVTADLVITGEGSFDEQTLRGKAPLRVLSLARAQAVPAVVVCGRTTLAPSQFEQLGVDQVHALSDREPDLQFSMQNAAGLIEEVGGDIAREIS